MTPHELKNLESRLRNLSDDISKLRIQRDDFERRLRETENERAKVQAILTTAKSKPKRPIVTEHAMIRYLERVEGLDTIALQEKILPSGMHELALSTDGYILVGNSHKVVMQNGIVKTIGTITSPYVKSGGIKPWATEEEDEV